MEPLFGFQIISLSSIVLSIIIIAQGSTGTIPQSGTYRTAAHSPKIFRCPGKDFSLVTYTFSDGDTVYPKTICVNLKRICTSGDDGTDRVLTYPLSNTTQCPTDVCHRPFALCDMRCNSLTASPTSPTLLAGPICCPRADGLGFAAFQCVNFNVTDLNTAPMWKSR
ncbi:hypothetical protein BV898_06082 [Hypsibius exemplaris]|uniref:Single domain-containing protein n=1 Tax=Hypsibius exemplaris TaxID=2072580 RepID=A0A1W0WX79_HYPEX|nr:hypothetical protein BV898_06082 [Hypsibius exemplaris]